MTMLTDDAFVRLFQERAGLEPDGWPGLETVAALNRLMPAKTPPVPAGIILPDAYWPMLSKIESGDRPYVRATTSSASGLYQFIKATWQGEGGSWGATGEAFGGLRPTVDEQLKRAKSFTMKNARYLAGLGVPINPATLYAAHFLGPVTAGLILAAPALSRADQLAGPAATAANKSILEGKRVSDFLDWLKKKTGYAAR